MNYEQMIGVYVIITGMVYKGPNSLLWPFWLMIYTIGFTIGWAKGAINLIEDN
jgi:hypothetical protein